MPNFRPFQTNSNRYQQPYHQRQQELQSQNLYTNQHGNNQPSKNFRPNYDQFQNPSSTQTKEYQLTSLRDVFDSYYLEEQEQNNTGNIPTTQSEYVVSMSDGYLRLFITEPCHQNKAYKNQGSSHKAHKYHHRNFNQESGYTEHQYQCQDPHLQWQSGSKRAQMSTSSRSSNKKTQSNLHKKIVSGYQNGERKNYSPIAKRNKTNNYNGFKPMKFMTDKHSQHHDSSKQYQEEFQSNCERKNVNLNPNKFSFGEEQERQQHIDKNVEGEANNQGVNLMNKFDREEQKPEPKPDQVQQLKEEQSNEINFDLNVELIDTQKYSEPKNQASEHQNGEPQQKQDQQKSQRQMNRNPEEESVVKNPLPEVESIFIEQTESIVKYETYQNCLSNEGIKCDLVDNFLGRTFPLKTQQPKLQTNRTERQTTNNGLQKKVQPKVDEVPQIQKRSLSPVSVKRTFTEQKQEIPETSKHEQAVNAKKQNNYSPNKVLCRAKIRTITPEKSPFKRQQEKCDKKLEDQKVISPFDFTSNTNKEKVQSPKEIKKTEEPLSSDRKVNTVNNQTVKINVLSPPKQTTVLEDHSAKKIPKNQLAGLQSYTNTHSNYSTLNQYERFTQRVQNKENIKQSPSVTVNNNLAFLNKEPLKNIYTTNIQKQVGAEKQQKFPQKEQKYSMGPLMNHQQSSTINHALNFQTFPQQQIYPQVNRQPFATHSPQHRYTAEIQQNPQTVQNMPQSPTVFNYGNVCTATTTTYQKSVTINGQIAGSPKVEAVEKSPASTPRLQMPTIDGTKYAESKVFEVGEFRNGEKVFNHLNSSKDPQEMDIKFSLRLNEHF